MENKSRECSVWLDISRYVHPKEAKKKISSFDDSGDVSPKAPKIRSGNTTPLATDSFSEGAASE